LTSHCNCRDVVADQGILRTGSRHTKLGDMVEVIIKLIACTQAALEVDTLLLRSRGKYIVT
jgi:hypothetical protein